MLAAHAKGKLVADRYRSDYRSISAATERRRILGAMSERDKSSLSKLFGSIARGTVGASMSKVRDALVGQLQASVKSGSSPKADLKKTMKSLGFQKGNSHVVNTVVRTQTAMAFNAAVWQEAMDDPEVWGFRYSTAGDERVRLTHQAIDGTTLPKSHKFWMQFAPPNGWNCRCGLEMLFDPQEEVITVAKPEVDAAFRFNPRILIAKGLSA
jgi:SPP1 gp7 family putative phage head morphogenesis protein